MQSGDDDERLELRIGDIPDPLMSEIARPIANYSTSLFALPHKTEPQPRTARESFAGSGTFVSFQGTAYLMTAAHVWETIQRMRPAAIGISLVSFEAYTYPMPMDLLVPYLIEERSKREAAEWGPDLAFVRIPESHLGRIRAHLSIYNLERHQAAALQEKQDRKGLWIPAGSPEELCSFAEDGTFETKTWSFMNTLDGLHQRGDHDYVDMYFDYSEPLLRAMTEDAFGERDHGSMELPRTFGGLSGGGLWRAVVSKSRSTGELVWVDNSPHLEGVVFYESPVENGRRFVRAHGKRSIFGKGLERLAGR